MAIGETISKIFSKTSQKRDMYQHAKAEDEIARKIEYKKLSSVEAELNEYQEKERQERMKKAVQRYRKKQDNEFLHGHNLRKVKPIFNQPIIFKDGNVLKQRSLMS